MKMPYHDCPSFNNCSAPKCPLDPEIDDRDMVSGEPKCRAEKPTRVKIGKNYPELLKYQGLTKREFIGKRNWDGLDTTKRVLILQRLSKSQKTPNSGITEA